MRKILFLTIITLALTSGIKTNADVAPILPGDAPNVREVTISQIYRYAREMYRYGNYPEAIKAFKQILAIDCNNKVAQYHLMKLAKKSPEFNALNDYLKNLPCPLHNFDEDDFLPASLYYESDAALMQEQLAIYNKRFRIARESLKNAADNYTKLTQELEEEIISLRKQLTDAKDAPAKETDAINAKLTASRTTAARMDQEIAKLKDNLTSERQRHADEITRLHQEMANIKPSDTMADANRAALKSKEQEIEAKDEELATLQQKFDDLQNRLRAIQSSVEEKNNTIKAIQSEINNLQR